MPAPLYLYLDTEYTSHEQPLLLALGLVSDGGEEFYAELSLQHAPFEGRQPLCNAFVQAEVLPQLGRGPSFVDEDKMAEALALWLGQWPSDTLIFVSYDWSTDFQLLEQLLLRLPQGASLLSRLEPVNLSILNTEPSAEAAKALSWQQSLQAEGVGAHHALADARALRAAYHSQSGESSRND